MEEAVIVSEVGAEIRKMLKEIERNNKGLYDKVLGGNWKPENIKDKK